MHTKEVIRVLEKWSPKGLCDGQYIKKNGAPEKTEACTVGCLMAEVLFSEEAIKVFKAEKTSKKKVFDTLINDPAKITDALDEKIDQLVDARFGTTKEERDHMVDFNDNCLDMEASEREEFEGLPRDLKRVIFRLRKKYYELDR